MIKNKSILFILFIISSLFLTSCSSQNTAALIEGADQDYFLGLKLLEENKENEARLKLKNCMEKGSSYCAKHSAILLTTFGTVQEKNRACTALVKKFPDEESKLIAAQQFYTEEEISMLLSVTDKIDLTESDNLLIRLRMEALTKRQDTRLKDELIKWFTTRQISTEHYKYYRDVLPDNYDEEIVAMINYRIDIYKRDYHKAFEESQKFYDYFEEEILPPYGQLVSDIGKASLYGSKTYYENGLNFQYLAKKYKETQAEFYFWFYAGRSFARTETEKQKAIACYEKAVECAATDKQKDNALWYLLDSKITDSYKTTIKELGQYAIQWSDPDYFDDFFETLIMTLTVNGDWNQFPILMEQIDGYASKEITAKVAYISGRLYQNGYIKTKNKEEKINELFVKACDSGTSTYYKLLAAWQLGLSKDEIETLLCKPITENEINVDPGAESLLKGYVQFGYPEKIYDEWQKIYKKGVSTDVSMYLASFLSKCSKENDDYITLSIRIAARSANISDRPLTKDELKLIYPVYYDKYVEKYCNKYEMDPNIIYALIRSESFFDADVESTAGAIGLTQLMQITSEDIARKLKIEEYSLTDPEINIHFGTYYLSELYKRCEKNILQAFFSYNAGITRVRRWLNSSMIEYGEKKNMPDDLFLETVPYSETREYGRKLVSASTMYNWLYTDSDDFLQIVNNLIK